MGAEQKGRKRKARICQNVKKLQTKLIKLDSITIGSILILPTYKRVLVKCPPLKRINFGRHKSLDNNIRMIQLTNLFCVLFIYNDVSYI